MLRKKKKKAWQCPESRLAVAAVQEVARIAASAVVVLLRSRSMQNVVVAGVLSRNLS